MDLLLEATGIRASRATHRRVRAGFWERSLDWRVPKAFPGVDLRHAGSSIGGTFVHNRGFPAEKRALRMIVFPDVIARGGPAGGRRASFPRACLDRSCVAGARDHRLLCYVVVEGGSSG